MILKNRQKSISFELRNDIISMSPKQSIQDKAESNNLLVRFTVFADGGFISLLFLHMSDSIHYSRNFRKVYCDGCHHRLARNEEKAARSWLQQRKREFKKGLRDSRKETFGQLIDFGVMGLFAFSVFAAALVVYL